MLDAGTPIDHLFNDIVGIALLLAAVAVAWRIQCRLDGDSVRPALRKDDTP